MVKCRLLSATRPPAPGNWNLLLAALPAEEYKRIVQSVDIVPLKLRSVVHRAGEPIEHVYFPGGGFCSMLTVLKDGGMVEVATIGREGAVGVSAVLDGNPVSSALSMVQGETNTCYRMRTDAFRREMDRRGVFYALLTHYAQALIGFIMQSTACNAVHSVEQRLARWLLMAQDRMESDDFPLTQEFAAMMLGASRPTVTMVASTLQRAGLITYHRGHLSPERTRSGEPARPCSVSRSRAGAGRACARDRRGICAGQGAGRLWGRMRRQHLRMLRDARTRGEGLAMSAPPLAGRAALLQHGLHLEFLTVAWNVVEAAVAIAAAVAAGSVALLGFGVDSVIESASGGILIWRLKAEVRMADPGAVESLDRRAHKLVALSLLLLAAYIAVDAARTLWLRERPEPSLVGIAVTTASLGVMVWLARAKRRAARALESGALEADAFQTTACWWLSLTTLVGIGLNATFGWWWADPVAALGLTLFLVQEAREAWSGDECHARVGADHVE